MSTILKRILQLLSLLRKITVHVYIIMSLKGDLNISSDMQGCTETFFMMSVLLLMLRMYRKAKIEKRNSTSESAQTFQLNPIQSQLNPNNQKSDLLPKAT